ncbi:MAG: HAD-IIIA family hydrolase, partial [Prevotellaceae bacterium]|nr:HAD-IIIA family hydrolase [Prevotellaceae bacterium]
MNKAVFLDRDGVINSDDGHYYVYRRSDFVLTPRLGKSLKRLHDAGFMLIVVTNQGGVARGIYSSADVESLSDFLRSQMADFGVPIAEVYSCLHHPDMGKCLCRKPSPLLVQRAMARFNIDPAQSYLIGDR